MSGESATAPEPKDLRADLLGALRHPRRLLGGVVAVAGLLWAASGIYAVKPEQRGVVKRFGAVVADDVAPGIHYHWPWPAESVERPRTTEVRALSVPFTDAEGEEGALLTGDENLVAVTLQVQYTIDRPGPFLYGTADAPGLLERLTRDAAIARFAGTGVDQALGAGWQEIQVDLREQVQAAADRCRLGVRVASVRIQRVEPPPAVAPAFKDVASAREDKQKLAEEADGERNRRLPAARADAARMRSEAEGRAGEAVQVARGDAERFLSSWGEYKAQPSLTARRLYLEAIEEVLPRVRKIVVSERAEGLVPRGR